MAEPVAEIASVEEPVAEEPVVEAAPVEEPVAEEPVVEPAPVEEPVLEAPWSPLWSRFRRLSRSRMSFPSSRWSPSRSPRRPSWSRSGSP